MEKEEGKIFNKFCQGNRITLSSIPPLGIDYEMPIGRFLFVFKSIMSDTGYIFLENKSNSHKKVFFNSKNKTAYIVLIEDNKVNEINIITLCDDLDSQLEILEFLMSRFVDLYGAPHEWLTLDNNATACSWDAMNGNSLSIAINRMSQEIICKYLKEC